MSLTAIYSGTTALQAESTAIDVVGQNLANLNTTAFKAQRAGFKDAVYQTLYPGSAPTGNSGGANPAQTGSGVSVGAVGSLFQQGAITPTGLSTDAAIQGDGFFVLHSGSTTAYSRNGAFAVDAQGYLIDPNTGYRVQRTGTVGEPTPTSPGFQVAGNEDIKVPIGAATPGVATTQVTYQGNFSGSLAVGGTVSTTIQMYDAQSTPQSLSITFTKTAANTFQATGTVSGGGTVSIPAGTNITFNNTGLLVGPATIAATVTFGANPPQNITLNLGTPGQSTGLTQFGGSSTATAVTQDGSGFGTLTSISFDQSGQIEGQFSNGLTIPIAQLAIAGFNNNAGLLRQGNNYFSPSPASGQAIVGPAGAGGRGTVQGSALEGANVDIATEFSNLIIAQRAYQANSETITVVNEVLQTLTNIIR